MATEVSLYLYEDDAVEPEPNTPEFWVKALNDRAVEFGLERNVRAIIPKYPGDSYIWAYELPDGTLAELGWNVEGADKQLKEMSGAQA